MIERFLRGSSPTFARVNARNLLSLLLLSVISFDLALELKSANVDELSDAEGSAFLGGEPGTQCIIGGSAVAVFQCAASQTDLCNYANNCGSCPYNCAVFWPRTTMGSSTWFASQQVKWTATRQTCTVFFPGICSCLGPALTITCGVQGIKDLDADATCAPSPPKN